MKRKIVFVTGTRADFGKLKPLVAKVAEHSTEFEYELFVTGMHVMRRFGSTVGEIVKAGFTNIFPFINQDGNVNSQSDIVMANTINGFSHYVRETRPDLIVVHGDRIEALACATVGALNNMLVAHIEGGEISGTVDEFFRHAVTKLAHIHFVANDEARRRLIQLGEIKETINVIGSPEIDIMLSPDLPAIEEVKRYYNITFDDYCILIYHPVTTEIRALSKKVGEVVKAVLDSGRNFIVIHPNSDAGADIILDAFESGFSGLDNFYVLPSMRFEYFLTLMKNAEAIVGNSSAGVREAPVYGIKTINIGTRQMNRCLGRSIFNVEESAEKIYDALMADYRKHKPSLRFGRGNSAQLFIECLHAPDFWNQPRQKQFQDLGYDILAAACE